MTALFQAETAPLPPAKAPFWHKQALFSLMTAPFEADTGPSHQRRRPSSTKRRPLCASFNQVRCRSGRDRHMTVPLRPFIRFDQTLLAPQSPKVTIVSIVWPDGNTSYETLIFTAKFTQISTNFAVLHVCMRTVIGMRDPPALNPART